MRTIELLVDDEIGAAKLGVIKDINNAIDPVSLNQLVPYISGPEDLEVLLKNAHFVKGTPFEFNGFKTKLLLSKANKLEMCTLPGQCSYTTLVKKSLPLMSFPSEVVWLSVPDGVEKFQKNIEWVLQKDDIGFDYVKAKKIAEMYVDLIRPSYQNYSFWVNLANKFEGEHLFSLLIESSVELAVQAKMKFLSGIVPVIDRKRPNSIEFSHKINLGYGTIIADMEDHGYHVPGYFYTINLNPSMIRKDDYSDELNHIILLAKNAMGYNWFDGIYISVRGLKDISGYDGRVATLLKFIEDLTAVAHDEHIPIWLSRFGLIGLATFDMGVSFSSYTPNMGLRDVFTKGFVNNGHQQLHGKVFNIHMRKILDLNQVKKLPYGLTPITGVRNTPTYEELESPVKYRVNFSKPYNIAAMNQLAKEWHDNVIHGEMNPGREYLKTFTSPSFYSTWGCD